MSELDVQGRPIIFSILCASLTHGHERGSTPPEFRRAHREALADCDVRAKRYQVVAERGGRVFDNMFVPCFWLVRDGSERKFASMFPKV